VGLSLVNITKDQFEPTSAICAKQFGPRSYQATSQYLHWLYSDNPRSDGRGILGYENGELVAVSHEIAAWSETVTECIVAHNLFTYPDTKTGIGGKLIMRYAALPMVVPGATPPLNSVYQAARFVEIPIRSYMTYLMSPRFLIQWTKAQMSSDKGLTLKKSQLEKLAEKYRVHIDSDMDENKAYVEHIYEGESITPEFLCWRYFSKTGPATIVISDEDGNFVFINIGLRKNAVLARMADHHMDFRFLAQKVFPILTSLGVIVVMANSRYENEWELFIEAGMKRFNEKLKSFVTQHVDPSLVRSSSFSDLGLESIKTKII